MSNQYSNYGGYNPSAAPSRPGPGSGPPPPPPSSYGAPGAPYGGGPQRGYQAYGGDRDARRPGPYDDRERGGGGGGGYGGGGPPGGGARDSGWGAGRGGGMMAGRRRSASPDYSRGAAGGAGGPPSRGYGDDRGGYGGYGGGGGGGYGGGPPRGPPGGYGGGGGPGAFGRQDLGDPFSRGGPAPGERDEAEVIRQRVVRERPCRTLFVRNLKFGLMPEDVRRPFAEIGDIKTFFDLVEKRAIAFVTYYDARAAMMAKDRMHHFPLMGRPMDVHYSLPRDADLAKGCDRETGQGTLSIKVRNGPPGMTAAPSDVDIHQRFAPFGDIKLVFADPRRDDIKYIEYYDSRGAVKAYDHLNGRPFPGGGTLDLAFEWDKPAPAPAPVPVAPPQAQHGGYGFQQPGAGAYGAPAPHAGASPYAGGASPYPGAPPPPPPAAMSPYGAAAPPPPLAGGAPPAPAPHGVDHAKKMQDLLASLVANNQGALGPPVGQQQQQHGQAQYGAPPQPQQQQHSHAYPSYAPGPTPAPAPAQAAQPYNGASPLPPAIGSPLGAAAGAQAPASSLPAAVTSLLAQAAGAPAPAPPSGAAAQDGGSTPQQRQQQNGGYSPAPASGSAPASPEKQGQGQAQAPAQVQALLALLAQQKQG
ncbi:hypothetical protein JCM9279_003394 [Rhodotorula babjevae]